MFIAPYTVSYQWMRHQARLKNKTSLPDFNRECQGATCIVRPLQRIKVPLKKKELCGALFYFAETNRIFKKSFNMSMLFMEDFSQQGVWIALIWASWLLCLKWIKWNVVKIDFDKHTVRVQGPRWDRSEDFLELVKNYLHVSHLVNKQLLNLKKYNCEKQNKTSTTPSCRGNRSI